jgi:hypothetical protein
VHGYVIRSDVVAYQKAYLLFDPILLHDANDDLALVFAYVLVEDPPESKKFALAMG